MSAVCPKCNQPVPSLNILPVKASDGSESEHEAIILSCPKCSVVLGAELNPVEVKEQLLKELETRLR